MELIETGGIVIATQGYGTYSSIDLLTPEYGILHWYNDQVLDNSIDYLFDEIHATGRRNTVTACNFNSVKVITHSSDILKRNRSYEYAVLFAKVFRSIVFDGTPLGNLFDLTKQTIKNFSLGFNPEIVTIKALYLICRHEGYAVDSLWINSLSSKNKALALQIIRCKTNIELPKTSKIILKSLRDWILSI